MNWTFRESFLALGIVAQLLLLRLLDEFKDNEYDQVHHPDRVLQKGILSVEGLKVFVFLAVSTQTILNIIWGDPMNGYWLAMMAWTYLMTKEFFIGEWLRKRVFLYLASHMVVMLFLVLWLFSFYEIPLFESWPVIAMIFTGSVLYEITRKSRGLDEDKRLDSYPKEIGFIGNSALLFLLTAALLAFKFFFITNATHFVYLWDVFAVFAFVISIVGFQVRKTKKMRKLLEANYGGLMMALYLSFVLKVSFFL